MAEAKLKLRRHRTVIVLICLALLVILMQGASYFSLGHQLARSQQVEQLTQTLARQVAFSLAPLMDSQNDGADIAQITTILNQLTDNSRILDASVYQLDGSLIAHSGETVPVRDRLALDGKRAGSYFNHQIVQPIGDKDGPSGFLRMTLDTHVLATEAKQVDNTTNLLRLMMLLALAVGIILARTLLQGRRSRWEQSPFLLTASTRLRERDEDDDLPAHNNEPLVIAIAEERVEDKPTLTAEEEAELEAVQAAHRNLQRSEEPTDEEEDKKKSRD
ncbi:YtjB family periplasmic protein [Rouxiella sp. S1S-2]|uniref:YtjB family periplasmic protein n=1 Tax=Rouxiella sp. S1S-2 TaxID=2653856 RepID=UPI0012659273|nr:YtjB family periplasmic protein [Rouxiella sp. S1S-2]KAB7898460.1 YtjB family periplasmic protein [Rouxiella sp. S1S-2]